MKNSAVDLFFSGLLPIIAFTFVEESYGIIPGLVAGMIFGASEILWELYRDKKVQKITWIGNGLLLTLGAVSLISSEGIWFKLQPAIFEGIFTLVLLASVLMKKPLLAVLAEQQGHALPEMVKASLHMITLRTALFFAIHTLLATWAAFSWTTGQWALLKGVGLTVSFVLYLGCEVFWLRLSLRGKKTEKS